MKGRCDADACSGVQPTPGETSAHTLDHNLRINNRKKKKRGVRDIDRGRLEGPQDDEEKRKKKKEDTDINCNEGEEIP